MDWAYLPPVLRVAGRMAAARAVKKLRGLDPMVLGHMVEIKARKSPGRTVLIFEREGRPDEAVTYASLFYNSNKLAHELLRRGLKRGDRFAVYMRNHPESVYALAAASMTGTIAVLIDPRNRGDILAHILRDSRARLLIFADYLQDDVRTILPSSGITEVLAVTSRDEGGAPAGDFDDLGRVLSQPDRVYVENAPTDPMAPFQIIYTSGTTGMPKGVVQPNMRFFFLSSLSYFFGYRPSDVLYTGLSLSHGNAQAVTVFPAIARGIRAVLSRKFTKTRLWDITRKYGVTTFSLLGGMASGIYNEPPRPSDADNPVRMVVSAGTPRAIAADFERRFGVKILEWYAAVEGGFTYKPLGTGPAGSFGKRSIPLLIDFKVVDENDVECPPGTKGELVSRMRVGETRVEYLGKPELSEQKTRGGWLRSGDLCHMDAEGWLYFDCRKGGELRRHGDFVPQDVIEKVVGEIDDVSEVFVYGVPARTGAPGESDIVAAVSPFPGKTVDSRRIFEECRRKLPANFCPTFVQVLPDIPKTPSEKPKEQLLRTTFRPDGTGVFTEGGASGRVRA